MSISTTNSIRKPPLNTSVGCKVGDYLKANTQMFFCSQHGHYEGHILLEIAGKKVVSLCPVCKQEKKRQETQQTKALLAQREQEKIANLLKDSGIPQRFKTRTFENYRILHSGQQAAFNIIRTYADHFNQCLAAGGGLILTGKPGTGKTHLAAAVANQIISTGHSVLFTSAMHVLRRVKESYQHSTHCNQQTIIDGFISPDLLIIDEIGVQFGTETEKLIFFEILNGRYEELLPTMIVSNLTKNELSLYLGTRILDRLQEGGGAFVRFDWESYRKQVHLDADLSTPFVTSPQ